MNKVNLSGLSVDELVQLNQRIVKMVKSLRKAQTQAYVKGDRVSFHNQRYNRVMKGTVERLGREYVVVRVDDSAAGLWRVNPEAIKLVFDEAAA